MTPKSLSPDLIRGSMEKKFSDKVIPQESDDIDLTMTAVFVPFEGR